MATPTTKFSTRGCRPLGLLKKPFQVATPTTHILGLCREVFPRCYPEIVIRVEPLAANIPNHLSEQATPCLPCQARRTSPAPTPWLPTRVCYDTNVLLRASYARHMRYPLGEAVPITTATRLLPRTRPKIRAGIHSHGVITLPLNEESPDALSLWHSSLKSMDPHKPLATSSG